MTRVYIFCLLLLIIGCNQDDFSPVEDFSERLTVFSILDTRKEVQLVKIQKSTSTTKLEDSAKLTTGLQVKVFSSGTGLWYAFKDTVIDTIKNFNVFYCKNMVLQLGSYTLQVISDKFPPIWATTGYVTSGKVSMNYELDYFYFNVGISQYGGFCSYRIYQNYQQRINGEWINKTIQIPEIVEISDKRDTVLTYPPKFEFESRSVRIKYSVLQYIRELLGSTADPEDIEITNRYIITTSFDNNLYSYYKTLNNSFDPYSIRLDQPNYTNINNGYGIFGFMREDSSVIY